MKNKQRALRISLFILSTLFLLNLTITFSTIYNTGWINTYIRGLAERSEYSVEEMPWFTRIDHISDSSLPYGTDDASGKINVSVFHAELSKHQAERAKKAFENTENTRLVSVESVKQLMDETVGLGYATRLLTRPGYTELGNPKEYFIVDTFETSAGNLGIGHSVHLVFYENYRKCYLAIYEPYAL